MIVYMIDDLWSLLLTIAALYFCAMILMSFLSGLINRYTDIGRDATDPPHGRSDMKILTDHETGCQYLAGARGGLTPRLDSSGKPMCGKKGGPA